MGWGYYIWILWYWNVYIYIERERWICIL
jgi:hypothetical protein